MTKTKFWISLSVIAAIGVGSLVFLGPSLSFYRSKAADCQGQFLTEMTRCRRAYSDAGDIAACKNNASDTLESCLKGPQALDYFYLW